MVSLAVEAHDVDLKIKLEGEVQEDWRDHWAESSANAERGLTDLELKWKKCEHRTEGRDAALSYGLLSPSFVALAERLTLQRRLCTWE